MLPTNKQPLFIISGASGVGNSFLKRRKTILYWKAIYFGVTNTIHHKIIIVNIAGFGCACAQIFRRSGYQWCFADAECRSSLNVSRNGPCLHRFII